MQYSAVGLTDLTNLFGLLEFYRSSREKGIKPIVGAEVNVIKDKDSLPAPIVLLVKDRQGYINLTKIVSEAYVDGQVNGEPMVELSLLQKHSEGLIALSGGMEGHVGQYILAGNIPLTESRIKFFKSIFDEDFFIEVHRLGKTNEEEYNNAAIDIATKRRNFVIKNYRLNNGNHW